MKERIRKLFRQKFDLNEYRDAILQNLLHAQQLKRQPEFLEETPDGDRIFGLGFLYDSEGKQIGLYYTEVAKGDVRRKRVGFHTMMKKYREFMVDAAVVVFDDKHHWRLSYMSDLKGSETSAKRFSYVLGESNELYNTPVNRLAALGTKVPHLLLEDLKETFSVDSLSDEFFKEYHQHYDIIIDYLAENANLDVEDSVLHDYVKKMMGRIVFLHFLQKKGWLNGDTNYLKNLFFMQPLDRQADFLEQVLEPLFFGIFNTESDNRRELFEKEGWDLELLEQWRDLPYLNGGLFERDDVDNMRITLPSKLFEDLFEFMASYNFTVDENDPDDAEVGVDPEMLGKIFESLLEDNKAKGAFYTPKEIVRYMCKESLIAYLCEKVSDNAAEGGNNKQDSQDFESEANRSIRRFVETHELPAELEPCRDALSEALREVKICDPAIGSGAFPMGLLNELWRCREALLISNEEFVNGNYSRAELKREIIENNVYGVDIERGAIDIARLRFWLSIVVDAEKPEPLPNFDYKFMQGNSLIESFDGHDLSHIMDKEGKPRGRGGYQRSIGGQESYQVAFDFSSADTRQNLRLWLKKYFSLTDHREKAEYRQRINESVKEYIKQQGIGAASEARLDALDPSANQDFFLWHTWFKDIFDKGGFDIVIGNPPYISAPTQIANETLAKQRERIVSSKRYKSLYQKWDLYIPFIELGIMLNVPSGITTMIVPFPLTNQLYAKVLRKMLVDDNDMYELVDLNGTKIFENATVSNCIPFVKKAKTKGKTWISNIDEQLKITRTFEQNHSELIQDEKTYVWNVTQEKRETNRHADMHVLGDYCYISVGMVLNADEKNAKGEFSKEDLISNTKDKIHCREYIEAKDVGKFIINRVRYLEYDTERVPDKVRRPTFRELYNSPKLVMNCLGTINSTLDLNTHFLHNHSIYCGILWKDLSKVDNKSISSSIKKFSTMPRADMEILSEKVDLRYLLGVMNSKYASVLLTNLRGGDYHIYPEHIRNIPIPTANSFQQQSIIKLVDAILAAKKNNPKSDTSSIEREIDQQVYALYNLTPEEIAVVEQ